MDRVFIYWDDNKILQEGQRLAEERDGRPGAGSVLRLNCDALLKLAHADRPVEKANLTGPTSAVMRYLWNCLDAKGIKADISEREVLSLKGQRLSSYYLHRRMIEDGIDYHDDPGILVLLTGDGACYMDNAGLHDALERLHERGWRIEILSWANFCDQRMRKWAEKNGVFVALEDYYESITYLDDPFTDGDFTPLRESTPLDLSRRPGCSAPGLATKPAAGVQPAAARG